jgi:hypothetical protein
MKVSSRIRPHHIYIAEIFRYHAGVLKDWLGDPEFEDRFMFAKGNVANDLFRSTAEVQTGLITKEAHDMLVSNPKYTPTKEHIMSRNRAAEHILRRILNTETSEARLLNMIIASCRTVFSTKGENQVLEQQRKKLQDETARCILPWRKLYSELGLLPSPKRQRSNPMIMVNEQVYTTAKIAAKHLSLSSTEVRRRCKSSSKKWTAWREVQMVSSDE